jgi:hypothetical protein
LQVDLDMALLKLSQVDAIHKFEDELLTATCSKDGKLPAGMSGVAVTT